MENTAEIKRNMHHYVKIGIWNANSVRNRIHDLTLIIEEYDIICICETWMRTWNSMPIRGYKIFHSTNNLQSGHGLKGTGMAIIYRDYLSIKIVKEKQEVGIFEYIRFQLENSRKEILYYFNFIYRSPASNCSVRKWKAILKEMDSDRKTIILGDLNAKDKSWNCSNQDNAGKNLKSVIEELDLMVLNTDTITRYSYNNDKGYNNSNIDLIIIPHGLAGVCEYSESRESLGSDHQILNMILQVNEDMGLGSEDIKIVRKTNKLYRNKDEINWTQIRGELEKRKEEIKEKFYRQEDLNRKYKVWYTTIQDIIIEFINQEKKEKLKRKLNRERSQRGEGQVKERKKRNIWWDKECEEAWTAWRKSVKKLWASGTPEDFHVMENLRIKWLQMKREKKDKSWEDFTNGISNERNISKIWERVRGLKTYHTKDKSALNKITRIQLEEEEIQKMTEINNKTTGITTEVNREVDRYKPQSGSSWEMEISNQEILMSINSIKNRNSAPSDDRVDYNTISELPGYMKELLCLMIKESWSKEELPEEWRTGRLCLIEKPGKAALRPITLTSCSGKILEKVINNRMNLWAESQNIIEDSQSGFRKKRSTIDNLNRIIMEIKKNSRLKKNTATGYIDIKGAYDNVDHNILLRILMKQGCPGRIVRWIRQWLTRRKIKIMNSLGEETEIPWKIGVPQGSILSPGLFNMYITGISEELGDPKIQYMQYADDIAIIAEGKNVKEVTMNIEKGITQLGSFLEERALTISEEKTVVTFFGEQPEENQVQVTIKNESKAIKISQEAKFLGVVIDNKLNFRSHITNVIDKLKKRINIIKYICRGNEGVSQAYTLMFTRALLASVVEYAAPIYLTSKGQKAARTALRKIETKALRTAVGYRQSTPLNVIYTEVGWTNITERAAYLAARYWLKQIEKGPMNNPTLRTFQEREGRSTHQNEGVSFKKVNISPNISEIVFEDIQNIGDIICKRNFVQEAVEKWENTNKVREGSGKGRNIIFDTEIGRLIETKAIPVQRTNEAFLERYNMDGSNTKILYTDGSKIPNAIANGIGIVEYGNNEWIVEGLSISTYNTIFTTEMIGIHHALSKFDDVEKPRNFIILTDSMSAIKGLESIMEGTEKNNINPWTTYTWKEILSKSEDGKIVIGWIPGHTGIRGNEMADERAKKQTRNTPNMDFKVPVQDLVAFFKEKSWDNFKENMMQIGSFKGFKFFTEIGPEWSRKKHKPWFYKFRHQLDRETIRVISRIRANHYNLKESLARKNIIEDPNCDCGLDKEDVDHVVFDCPLYNLERNYIWDKLKEEIEETGNSVIELIKLNKVKVMKTIMNYLKSINKRL